MTTKTKATSKPAGKGKAKPATKTNGKAPASPVLLTGPQVKLLAHLAAGNVITSDLPRTGNIPGGNFYTSPGYAGRIRYDTIDKLENAGYLAVKESGKGQRITITPDGKKAIR